MKVEKSNKQKVESVLDLTVEQWVELLILATEGQKIKNRKTKKQRHSPKNLLVNVERFRAELNRAKEVLQW